MQLPFGPLARRTPSKGAGSPSRITRRRCCPRPRGGVELTDEVKVMTTTTQPIMKEDVNTTGIEEYMRGLKEFAQTVEPGSARVISSIGDEHNALLIVSAKAAFGPGSKVTLTAARL